MVLGNFDSRGCLRKVLGRLHARLPIRLGWDWCFEKGPDGELGKSAWNFCGQGCLGEVLVRLRARLLGGLGWDWYLEIA